MRRALLAALLTAASISAAGISAAGAADQTLVISIQADPTGFDPEAVLNNTSGFVMATVFDSLVRYKPGTVEVEPGLAQGWDIADDGLTYTFHLRPGVTFHDGTPFNAETFVQGMDRLFKKDDPNYIYNYEPVETFVDFTYDAVDSYRMVDDSTVEFKLKHPSAPFLASLAMVWNGVVSPPAVAKFGKDFRSNPVGTGPFIFKEWAHGDQVTLEANPDYWGGKPKVDRLIFKVIPEPQAAFLALKNGTVHIMGDVVTQVIPAIQSDSNLELLTQPGLTINGIGMPTDTKPFDDVRVRQALNYAVDKKAINDSLYKGLAVTMTSPLPPAEWGFDDSLKGYPYDPEKAKALLKDAGYPDGFKTELLAYTSARGYNPAGPQLAVAVQGYLKQVGVEASVQQIEFGAYLAKARTGNYDGMFMVGWSGDNGDPDNFVGEIFGSEHIPVTNMARYRNPDLDQVLLEARRESDHDKRVELYQQAQAMIVEGAPWIMVNSTLQVRAERKEVKGFELNPTQMFFHMEKVSLEP